MDSFGVPVSCGVAIRPDGVCSGPFAWPVRVLLRRKGEKSLTLPAELVRRCLDLLPKVCGVLQGEISPDGVFISLL